jgi:hypothetical protein
MKTLSLALAVVALAAGGGKIKWESEYPKGLERAKKENKLMMVYFTADW